MWQLLRRLSQDNYFVAHLAVGTAFVPPEFSWDVARMFSCAVLGLPAALLRTNGVFEDPRLAHATLDAKLTSEGAAEFASHCPHQIGTIEMPLPSLDIVTRGSLTPRPPDMSSLSPYELATGLSLTHVGSPSALAAADLLNGASLDPAGTNGLLLRPVQKVATHRSARGPGCGVNVALGRPPPATARRG
jgi:hypothetical protein